MLARAYHGTSIHAVWQDGRFIEPESPPPFEIRFRRRGRGWQDTARTDYANGEAVVTVRTPYQSGRGQLVRTAAKWPATINISLGKQKGRDSAKVFRMANGTMGVAALLDDSGTIEFGTMAGGLDLGRPGNETFAVSQDGETPGKLNLQFTHTEETVLITVPAEMTAGNPATLVFEWTLTPDARVR